MTRPSRIGAEAALAGLDGWAAAPGGDAITKRFRFAGFGEAFAFMTRCALAAESLDHHPDWSNAYDRVKVTLTTHDVGGVTELDVKLAKIMDEAAARFGARGA